MTKRLDKKAVLEMRPAWVTIQRNQVRQRDGKEIRFYRIVAVLPRPLDKGAELLLCRFRLAKLLLGHSLIEEIIHRLVVVIASGLKRRAAFQSLAIASLSGIDTLLLLSA